MTVCKEVVHLKTMTFLYHLNEHRNNNKMPLHFINQVFSKDSMAWLISD